MRISTVIGPLLLLPGAFGASIQHRDASLEVTSVVPKDVQDQPLEKRQALEAGLFFAQFAFSYLAGRGLNHAFGDDDAPPPLSAANLEAFGDQLIEKIEDLIVGAATNLSQTRDTMKVDSTIYSLSTWRVTAGDENVNGLIANMGELTKKDETFNDLISYLKNPDYSARATPYYLAITATKIYLWRLRIQLALKLAAAQLKNPTGGSKANPNVTDSYIDHMRNESARYAVDLETHFLPKVKAAIGLMPVQHCTELSRSGKSRDYCEVQVNCEYRVPTLDGTMKMPYRNSPRGLHHKTACSGWLCSIAQCAGSDWTGAKRSAIQSSWTYFNNWRTSYFEDKFTLESELGQTLLTADFFNIKAGLEYVAANGVRGEYVRDESLAIPVCSWIHKPNGYPGVSGEVDFCDS